jgi:GT2 family glycosyltransferase
MLNNKIELSIIIVNYKSWKPLKQCLDSFKKYSPKAQYEIIVVDNDSRDMQLATFSKEFPEVSFIKNTGNFGFSNGCNLGANKARGTSLLFLNPDIVIMDAATIDEMLSYSIKNNTLGITTCRKITPKGQPEREITFFNSWLTIGLFRTIYKLIFAKQLKYKFPNRAAIWYPDWTAGSVILINKNLFNN